MFFRILFCLFGVGAATTAAAELQNVAVGGKIEIYGGWYSEFYEPNGAQIRIPNFFLPGRAIGANGMASIIHGGRGGNELAFYEQRTRLNFRADFTNSITAFIELDSIDTWGEDIRSDYRTGLDGRGATGDDIEIYQSYIDVESPFDWPVRLRIGRQELEFGSGWLVGADPGPDPFVGLSFDALRLTYNSGPFSVDAWVSKVADSIGGEQDGDVDFMGVYATFIEEGPDASRNPLRAAEMVFPTHLLYHGFQRVGPFRGRQSPLNALAEFELYWMFLRDARGQQDTNFAAPLEWIEDVVGIDDYDVTQLHTVGARAAGTWNHLDWEIEAAYQWGEADAVGALFAPVGQIYGDDGAQWSTWAGHAEAGYTMETAYAPRIFLGGAYYGGEDERDLSIVDWINPFHRPEASVSFNRLFTSWREDDFIDGSAMSNFWKAYAGVSAQFPTDAVEVGLQVSYLETLHAFDAPLGFGAGSLAIPVTPALPFLTRQGATDLGWQTHVWLAYAYSEDLSFEVGWAHFFTGDAVQSGSFVDENGLAFIGGRGSDDADYLYFLTTITF